jgi:hypothetical protein
MSHLGPSRHFAAKQRFGRFWKEADINRQAEASGLVANDPKRTCDYRRLDQALRLSGGWDHCHAPTADAMLGESTSAKLARLSD